MPKGTKMLTEIPPQIFYEDIVEKIKYWRPTIGAIVTAFITANWLLNLYLSGSIAFIWSMINTLQIIIHMPLIGITFPYNAFLMS